MEDKHTYTRSSAENLKASWLFEKAFDSAASRLGISPIDLATALQDGGISELVMAMTKVISYNQDIDGGKINYRPKDHIQILEEPIRAILAKIKKGE